jgi:hypothetical protein
LVIESLGPAQHFTTLYDAIAMPEADTTKPVHVVNGSGDLGGLRTAQC